MSAAPFAYWTPEQLAQHLACPLEAIKSNWPRIVEQLEHVGLVDHPTQVAMLSTIAIETAHRFAPIHEFRMADGSIPSYWYTYDGGPEFHGRGFIQNTHRYNYASLGPKIAELWGADPSQFDFVTRPDDLLEPDNSAAAAAIYFRDHGRSDGDGIPEAAARGDWREVRRLVQGGSAGLASLIQHATALGGPIEPIVDDAMAYSLNVPDSVILQQNNWSCAVRSTYAGLWAMSQVGQGAPVSYGDGGPRDVYQWMVPGLADSAVGLKDGSGAQLAAMLRDHGYDAGHVHPAGIEHVRERAGRQAVLLGGSGWYHWSYVRGKFADGGLQLENPSPGHMGIAEYLRDSYDRLGPWAMVWISPGAVVPPTPPPDDDPLTNAELHNLVANAYDDTGVVRPALTAAQQQTDITRMRTEVGNVITWLKANNPDPEGP